MRILLSALSMPINTRCALPIHLSLSELSLSPPQRRACVHSARSLLSEHTQHPNRADRLSLQANADVHIRDAEGRTALSLAGSPQVATRLLQAGADPSRVPDRFRRPLGLTKMPKEDEAKKPALTRGGSVMDVSKVKKTKAGDPKVAVAGACGTAALRAHEDVKVKLRNTKGNNAGSKSVYASDG